MQYDLGTRVRLPGSVLAYKVVGIDEGAGTVRVMRWNKEGFEVFTADFEEHWELYPVARYVNG